MNNKTIMDWRRRLKNIESAQNVDVVARAFIRTLACSVGMLLDVFYANQRITEEQYAELLGKLSPVE